MTSDQTAKIKERREERPRRRPRVRARIARELRYVSPEEHRAKLREALKKKEAQAEMFRKKIEETLSTSQFERLKQIRIQALGPTAFGLPDVAKALNLSKEQAAKTHEVVLAVIKKARGEHADLRKLSPEERHQAVLHDQAEIRKELQKARPEMMTAIMDDLTPEQRTKFEKLQGRED